MKLLLTSGGVTNASIRSALVNLLGKPIEDATALCIPTAMYGHPSCSPYMTRDFVAGEANPPMCDLGWKSVGLLELTALPTIDVKRWSAWLHDADALLAAGGAATYLAYWMKESGLTELLPDLHDTVWVGLSAGSMAMTPRIGDDFVEWEPPGGGDDCLGLVDFSIFPHLGMMPENLMRDAERWAAELGSPAYAIDDQTAITVVDGEVEVVSEGEWRKFD